jgi:hypothetical protein
VSKDGSSPRTVQLGSDGVRHTCIVDGVDLSKGLHGVQLTLTSGEFPTLTIDPLIFNLDGADLESARVVVADNAAQALVALGWTPPEETQ